MTTVLMQDLFKALYFSPTEESVEKIIQQYPAIFRAQNWCPIGANESNFSIIENQQSNPIAALVEKVTNSIDAILMKKCLEKGIAPKSSQAPQSMEEAIETLFPDHKNWDLPSFKRRQAEDIQIIADGPRQQSAVIIYDNGEGQHPEEFENTFLSLMRGNKNEIRFVQGKYNMGGSGAIVFCGTKGYQLIGSKRYDNKGLFGFTLIREHPLSREELITKKNTWYEYLKIDGHIPAFDITELDLKLLNRTFRTGTIIKMYSYQMRGISGFAQDLNQSLNEFLFRPVLPVFTIDTKERYPNNAVLTTIVYGLQRRLEEEKDYVETWFSEEYKDQLFGQMKVTCYLFKAKQEGKTVSDTKKDILRRYFKNNMSVLFSMNGQVHGHYTSEFITRGLKFNLLKDYLLIHVDCTHMKYEFRKDLFMASRDRLKNGSKAEDLRDYLWKKLAKSKLDEINNNRKTSIGLDSEDTTELIKNFAKNLSKDSDLFKLLQNTLKLEEKKKDNPQQKTPKHKSAREEKPFHPERFPSFFRLKHQGNTPIALPIGGEKTLRFETDVEDHYFDRTDEPGDLQVSVLQIKPSGHTGGTQPADTKEPGELLNIIKSSPDKGTIKITFNPDTELRQGDEIEIQVTLKGAGDDSFTEIVFLKIVAPDNQPKISVPKEEEDYNNIGLPDLVKVTKDNWDELEAQGITMNYNTVMTPIASGDILEKIYINLDSQVYLNYRSKLKNEDQILLAQKRYIASIYFHALFLYVITKKKNYKLSFTNPENTEEDITIDEYIRDVFDSYYSDFLLNFGMEQLMGALED